MFSGSFSLAALVLARAQEVALPDAATPLPPANHLAGESSPYLLQHAHNPVDWHPWGPAALAKAAREDKPIFLSIGYASCHWCHVMERESFEDPEIAAFLNRHFVAIKVDREERPDLDEIYMSAVQRLAGSGGWPMSVFLTPQRRPFYGGTYFPPRAAHGRPGFLELLQALEQAWRERRAEVEEVAAQVDAGLAVELPPAPPSPLPEPAAFRELEGRFVERLAATYDARHGGFGGAPKFPRADDLRWLLAAAERSGVPEARAMALHTLRRMAAGGMFDQLAGGFARYSVDERWLIPHFEKMLYDQGTLVPAYLEAWRQTGELRFAEVARATCDFLLRDLRDAGGAFWSSSDADSAGEEGRYFVWSPAELAAALGAEDAAFAAHAYDVTAAGNFEHGRSVLTRWQELDAAGEARLAGIRGRLLAARARRVAPAIDDKVLAGWNGLAIGALAQAGRLLDEPRFSAAAIEAAEFLLRELRRDGRWQRSWRDGRTGGRAVLEDHAFVARGFLELFQTTGEERWLREAEGLAARMLDDYWDPAAAVFWNTDGRDETLLHRSATPWDGALPSANAVALECLGLLAAFTRDPRWEEPARLGYAALAPLLERSPAAFTATLRPMVRVLEEPWLAVVAGGTAPAQGVWRRALAAPEIPELLVVFRPAPAAASSLEIFAGRGGLDGLPTLYLCQGDRCLAPETDPVRLPALVGAEEDSGR